MHQPPHLHERFPDLAGTLPHLALSARPTPVRQLAGLDVWVKEDGAFGYEITSHKGLWPAIFGL